MISWSNINKFRAPTTSVIIIFFVLLTINIEENTELSDWNQWSLLRDGQAKINDLRSRIVRLKPMIFVPGRSDSNHQWFNKQDCWTETNDLYYLFQDGQTKINDLMTRIVGLLPMFFVPGRSYHWFNDQDCRTETNDLYSLFQDGQTKINDLITRIVGLKPMIFVPGRFE